MADAYRDDLAYIHDVGFGGLATHAAAVLLKSLRQRGLDHGLVIDLGCGSGLLAHAVAAAGYDILGLDLSEAMLAMARQRLPTGQFCQASLWTAELPPCLAVTAIGECVNYLCDRSPTPPVLSRLFRRIYDALCPQGLLLFDAAEPGRGAGAAPQRVCAEGDDWAVLVTATEDRRHRVLTRRITSFRQVRTWYRRAQEVHRLRLFPHGDVAQLLRRSGFRVRLLKGYGPWRFPPGLVGFLAHKPKSHRRPAVRPRRPRRA